MENKMEMSSNFEKLYPEKFRVSVSNLVRVCRVRETSETFFIAMQGKPITLNGETYPRYQAIGGGAKVTPEGKEKIIEKYHAEFGISGRPVEEDDDARFFVPVPQEMRKQDEQAAHERNKYIAKVLSEFNEKNDKVFEVDITREMKEDLVSSGVISEEEFESITTEYAGAVSPIQWKTLNSEREKADIPSYRLFHLFDITVPRAVFEKLRNTDKIRVLSEQDISDIKASTTQGESATLTGDKSVIVENIFPNFHE